MAASCDVLDLSQSEKVGKWSWICSICLVDVNLLLDDCWGFVPAFLVTLENLWSLVNCADVKIHGESQQHTSCTGVPWPRSGCVSPITLPKSAASSLTCPRPASLGPFEGFGSFSSAKPLCDTTGRIRGWREAIEGLGLIASERLTPKMFNRGGMVNYVYAVVSSLNLELWFFWSLKIAAWLIRLQVCLHNNQSGPTQLITEQSRPSRRLPKRNFYDIARDLMRNFR